MALNDFMVQKQQQKKKKKKKSQLGIIKTARDGKRVGVQGGEEANAICYLSPETSDSNFSFSSAFLIPSKIKEWKKPAYLSFPIVYLFHGKLIFTSPFPGSV